MIDIKRLQEPAEGVWAQPERHYLSLENLKAARVGAFYLGGDYVAVHWKGGRFQNGQMFMVTWPKDQPKPQGAKVIKAFCDDAGDFGPDCPVVLVIGGQLYGCSGF